MTTSTSNHQFVALGLLALCAIAVILGVIQLAQTPGDIKAVQTDEPVRGALLGGSGDRLAYISLDGMIMEGEAESGLFASESSAVRARKLLYFAAKDKNVKGVLLRINSPGGTVGMSQELYNAILEVRKHKPVVVSMGDLAASGGYYTAAAADRIVANPGTLTASIGVIIQSVNAQGLLTDKLGVKPVTVKSGKFKDILSPYRAPSPEDIKLLQNIIDTSYRQFLTDVLEGRTRNIKDPALRNQRIADITSVADGRVVIGEDAIKVGLVDELGGLEDAKHTLQQLAGKRFDISRPDRLTLQEYETSFDLWQIFGTSSALPSSLKPKASLDDPKAMLPVTLRYANQPLWVMETVY